MAGISNAQELPPGHLQSPLFELIPAEVRLDIYRHVFAGSEMALQLHPDALKPRLFPHKPLPVGGRRSIFCTSAYGKRYQLLHTCKQIYSEALAISWSETIVCNFEGRLSRGLFFDRIPDFAKLHIKHLRDVQSFVNRGVKELRGIALSGQASFAETLDAFPKLQTCSIRDGKSGTKPSKAVEEALARHPEVHILKACPKTERALDLFKKHWVYKVCIWPATW